MKAINLRADIKKRVDATDDELLLKMVRSLLKGSYKQLYEYVSLNWMAELSERDIRKGNVYTVEEVKEYLAKQRKSRMKRG